MSARKTTSKSESKNVSTATDIGVVMSAIAKGGVSGGGEGQGSVPLMKGTRHWSIRVTVHLDGSA